MSYRYWILLTLLLAALPSLIHLPWWVSVIAALGTGIHFIGGLRKGWRSHAITAALFGAAAFGIWTSFESWFSGEAVMSFFVTAVFLKWGEARSRRDCLLLIFAAVILSAVGALYYETLLSLLHIFVVILALVGSLIAIHSGDRTFSPLYVWKQAAWLVLLGFPIMLLLFLTIPRIPGPLWDIGLAFGLPVKAMLEQGKKDSGPNKIKTVRPGQVHRVKQEKGNVLVAEFKGRVPPKSRLYWRGPVFYEFDGENWSLPENWDSRGTLIKRSIRTKRIFDRELRHGKDPVRYTLRVMPNGTRFLYGLELPASPGPEAFISEDFQLLSIRKLVEGEPRLELSAFLDYAVGSRLQGEKRSRALAWPQGTNPRLKALGKELASKYPDPKERISQGLAILASGGFTFDSAHKIPPGPDMLDRFFFDEKKGGTEYVAGGFAMLMRAAGVPSRLISGYRGGTIIALTNFVVVKNANAHLWVEVWTDQDGWTRVEPKDAVLGAGEKDKAVEKEKAPSAEAVVRNKKDDPEVQKPSEKPEKPRENKVAEEPAGRTTGAWDFLHKFSSFLAGFQKWIIDYNPDRQVELLKGMGIKKAKWTVLISGTAIGLTIIIVLYLSVAWWRHRARIDRAGRSWKKFLRKMEKLDMPKSPYECPVDYMVRIAAQRPDINQALRDIVGRYSAIRYEPGPSAKEDIKSFERQVDRFVAML